MGHMVIGLSIGYMSYRDGTIIDGGFLDTLDRKGDRHKYYSSSVLTGIMINIVIILIGGVTGDICQTILRKKVTFL